MYEIFIPQSKILKKYIHSFFVMNEFEGSLNYLAFPQLGTIMGLYKNSNISFGDNYIKISKSEKPNTQIILLGKYKLPIQLNYPEFLPEVSINFSPTGLNYFFNEDIGELANKEAQLVDAKNWITITNEMYSQDTNDMKIQILENFLIRNLIDKDLTKVEDSLFILNKNPEYSIIEIAQELNVSAKTINRHFENYVGCSPMDYKKIFRFRKAIEAKFNSPFKNLTEICFDSNFYDSPHFTKEFKKLTNMNPRDFFSDIRPAMGKEIPYKFL